MTKEDNDIIINNAIKTIQDYSEFVDLQNKELIKTRDSLEFCYKTGNKTKITLDNLASSNDTKAAYIKVVQELQECQTNCTAEIRKHEQEAIENFLADNTKTEKANSWCSDADYFGKEILCPLENVGKSLHDNIWAPIPTPVQYAIATVAIAATTAAAGYGVYSYLNPAVAPAVAPVVAPVVVNVPVIPAWGTVVPAAALTEIKELAGTKGYKAVAQSFLMNMENPDQAHEYYVGLTGAQQAYIAGACDELMNYINDHH